MVQGAETILYAALSPELIGKSGKYLENCETKKPTNALKDHDISRLWEITDELLRPWLEEKDQREVK